MWLEVHWWQLILALCCAFIIDYRAFSTPFTILFICDRMKAILYGQNEPLRTHSICSISVGASVFALPRQTLVGCSHINNQLTGTFICPHKIRINTWKCLSHNRLHHRDRVDPFRVELLFVSSLAPENTAHSCRPVPDVHRRIR